MTSVSAPRFPALADSSLLHRLAPLLRRIPSAWVLVLGALALGAAGGLAGASLLWRPPATSAERLVPRALPLVTAPVADGIEAELMVHVAGAVVRPGLLRLAPGARVADALTAAGGPAAEADLAATNLAAPLADGARVYFARSGEPAAGPPGWLSLPAGSQSGASAPSKVDVNRATARELEELPGVGPATAAAIARHREEHGPFRALEDLLAVPGIGPAKLEALRDHASV